jgi:hypothetical protein
MPLRSARASWFQVEGGPTRSMLWRSCASTRWRALARTTRRRAGRTGRRSGSWCYRGARTGSAARRRSGARLPWRSGTRGAALGMRNGPGRHCPILRDWRGGSGRAAAHRTRALLRARLSHFGLKMGQFVLHWSERRCVAAICAAALNRARGAGEAQDPQAPVQPKGCREFTHENDSYRELF